MLGNYAATDGGREIERGARGGGEEGRKFNLSPRKYRRAFTKGANYTASLFIASGKWKNSCRIFSSHIRIV